MSQGGHAHRVFVLEGVERSQSVRKGWSGVGGVSRWSGVAGDNAEMGAARVAKGPVWGWDAVVMMGGSWIAWDAGTGAVGVEGATAAEWRRRFSRDSSHHSK